MRVASLEERLAELEAENEELRVREAEAETPLLFGPELPSSPPATPRLTKDVAETLASLKAMGEELALSEAEKARESAAKQVAQAARIVSMSTQFTSEPSPPLAKNDFREAVRTFTDEAYTRGLLTGVAITLACVGVLWFVSQVF